MSKKTKTPKTLHDLPIHLRGPAQNQWGGHKNSLLRGLPGATYGPASECKTYSPAAKQAWEDANGHLCRK